MEKKSKSTTKSPAKSGAGSKSGTAPKSGAGPKPRTAKSRAAKKSVVKASTATKPSAGKKSTATKPSTAKKSSAGKKSTAISEGFPGAKRILMTGGTGFIGSRLREELLQQGHHLTLVTRQSKLLKGQQAKNLRFISWSQKDLSESMAGQDIVIHLAGESVAGKRWTDKVKKAIHDSRILTTRSLVDAMGSLKPENRPKLFISASAVGIYGSQGETILTETSQKGTDFLAMICVQWEAEALKAESLGIRVAIPRIGIVLGKEGGMLEKMVPPFQFFVGGSLGAGRQFVPWIHIDDVCDGILYPIEEQQLRGSYNLCAPEPARMKEFAKTMGHVLHRPSLFTVPSFALRIAFGESAEAILGSSRVRPDVLESLRFEFSYTNLEEALNDIL